MAVVAMKRPAMKPPAMNYHDNEMDAMSWLTLGDESTNRKNLFQLKETDSIQNDSNRKIDLNNRF